MQVSNSQNLSFQARKIALTKNVFNGKITHIDLYELSSYDVDFLTKLKEKTNISTLMPNLTEADANSWQDVFNYTINAALDNSIKKYLAVTGNKPCGIMAVQKIGRRMNLLGVSSIPLDVNKKVNFAGSTLFCQLFQMAKTSKSKSLMLEAMKNSAFDLVSKYREKGFFIGEEGERYISMHCPKRNVRAQLKKLQEATNYLPVKYAKEVSLDSII